MISAGAWQIPRENPLERVPAPLTIFNFKYANFTSTIDIVYTWKPFQELHTYQRIYV